MEKEKKMELAKKNSYRLDRVFMPEVYNLHFTSDIADFAYEADEVIHGNLSESTDHITLHGMEFKVTSAEYRTSLSGTPIQSILIAPDEKFERLNFVFPEKLPKGPGDLIIHYVGEINDRNRGFYRTKYKIGGEERYGATTQFEATDARSALVCNDEPDAKAIFIVSLTIPKHLTAISNMSPEDTKVSGDKKTVYFKPTPMMSTYLLYWGIAELECDYETVAVCEVGGVKKEIPVRGWVVPGRAGQTKFAVEHAAKDLKFYSEVRFGVLYPWDKLDMIAWPDFDAGAMENLGAVTYRETAMLIDPKNSSLPAYERVAGVVSHEDAHQWKGDLVTMKWWNGLWLNEGAASHDGPTAVHHHHPDWDIWSKFYAEEETIPALREASLKHAHPIEMPVENPAEIGEIFDIITYGGGAAVNRQNDEWLGEEIMRKGHELYLKRYAFRNAETIDFWKAFEEVSGKPVASVMGSFTLQTGYPMLAVKREQKNGKCRLIIRQERFFADGSKDPKAIWKIPLTIVSESGVRITILIDARTKSIEIPNASTGEWVKVNYGQSTFCRVMYEKGMREALLRAVEKKTLPAIDRIGLLDDALAMARAGHMRTSKVLEMLEAYRHEDNYYALKVASDVLEKLDHLIEDEDCHPAFDAYARDFYLPHAIRYGWKAQDGEHHLITKLRALVLHGAGRHGAQEIIDRALVEFNEHLRIAHDPDYPGIDPNLRRLVYSLVGRHGGHLDFVLLKGLYESSDLSEEKIRLLLGMGNARDEQTFGEFLEYLLSENVRTGDMSPVLGAAGAMHNLGRKMGWDLIQKRWHDVFLKRYEKSRLIGYALELVHGFFRDPVAFENVRTFFKDHPVPIIKRKMDQIIEAMEIDSAWLMRDREDIAGWLEAHVPKVD